uniref:Uncharacterized protein n=1 Tax=Anguilla anguilla TaxID=7936 RepID=A0A0E9Q423_ANGAN
MTEKPFLILLKIHGRPFHPHHWAADQTHFEVRFHREIQWHAPFPSPLHASVLQRCSHFPASHMIFSINV